MGFLGRTFLVLKLNPHCSSNMDINQTQILSNPKVHAQLLRRSVAKLVSQAPLLNCWEPGSSMKVTLNNFYLYTIHSNLNSLPTFASLFSSRYSFCYFLLLLARCNTRSLLQFITLINGNREAWGLSRPTAQFLNLSYSSYWRCCCCAPWCI